MTDSATPSGQADGTEPGDQYDNPYIIGNASELDRAFYAYPLEPPFDFWAWLVEAFPRHASLRIIELGSRSVCSKSVLKLHVEQHHPLAQYTGVDIYPGEGVDLVCDVHHLSSAIAEGSVDVIFSSAVFEHLAMPWLVAEEIAKTLRPGGHAFIYTHFSFGENEMPWHFFQFNSKGLEVLFNKTLGFKVIHSGKTLPMIGRFAHDNPPSLAGKPIGHLYCSSWIHAQREAQVPPPSQAASAFDWRRALPDVLGDTIYPPNTGLSKGEAR